MRRVGVPLGALLAAALVLGACGDAPRTAVRLVVNMPVGGEVDELHVVATLAGQELISVSVPEQVDGALANGTDVVIWAGDEQAGQAVTFAVAGLRAAALVAHGEGGATLKRGKTVVAIVQLEAAMGCSGGLVNCDGVCTDTTTDRDHCGRCDLACAAGEICRSSQCEHNPCGDGQHECSGACYPDDDPLHCGGSCIQCPVPAAHGTAACIANRCELDCDPGFVQCPGACVDLNTDPRNCGSCGHECLATQICRNSNCTSNACGSTMHECPGVGCVSNTSTATCGSSCTPCPVPSGGTATCDGVSCGVSCASGSHVCDGSCVTNYSTATCGTRCTPCPTPTNGSATCDGTTCGIACATNYHACGTACVSNYATATCGTRCTACPTTTNGTATCDGTSCGITCNNGYKLCGLACISNSATCATWRPVTTAATPPPRSYAAMAFDAQRNVTVLFGGWQAGSALNLGDTWEFNGANWVQRSPAAAPPARDSAAMAYDPVRHEVVLFGGWASDAYADTWFWDGTNWTQPAEVTSGPSARYGAQMVWDSIGGLVLFGGAEPGGTVLPADVWRWDGATRQWNQPPLLGTGSPPGRVSPGMIMDGTQIVVFGGASDWYASTAYGDQWTLGLTGWSQVTVARPSARGAPAFAFAGNHGNGILFGGFASGLVALGETWSWAGGQWTKLSPPTSPTPRGGAAVAYDSQRGVVVLFGGANGTTTFAETWEFVQ
jgi:hypothetical protein